jgi:hypothetical protein
MKITTILGRDPLTSSGVMDSIALASVAIEIEREMENAQRMVDEVNNGNSAPKMNKSGSIPRTQNECFNTLNCLCDWQSQVIEFSGNRHLS